MTEKGCDNCYYTYFDERAYPCSLCIRGIERTDQWQPSKKTKAESQTDLLVTEYPQDGEVTLIGRDKTEAVVMAYDTYKELTEPQTAECPFDDTIPCEWVCTEYGKCKYKPKTEPQTDCSWK